MNAEQRNVAREGQRFSVADANEKRTNESRCIRHCDRVEIIEAGSGFAQSTIDHRYDTGEMRAGCDLRHDAAKYAMDVLRKNHQRFLRDIITRALENGRGSLIARCLDAKNSGHCYSVRSVSSRSTSARASGEFQSVAVISFFLITPSLPMMNVSG